MKRHILAALSQWKGRANRKPLVMQGARQVGKTWAMKAFGASDFAQTAYVNFDNNPRMRALFAGDFDIQRLLLGLRIETGVDIQPENTLLIFDEVQEVPQALSSLKYFYENAPEFSIVADGFPGIFIGKGAAAVAGFAGGTGLADDYGNEVKIYGIVAPVLFYGWYAGSGQNVCAIAGFAGGARGAEWFVAGI